MIGMACGKLAAVGYTPFSITIPSTVLHTVVRLYSTLCRADCQKVIVYFSKVTQNQRQDE